MLEIDHLFVLTRPTAPEADRVVAAGFTEGSRNVHPGQGTANRRIFFHNAMLEFLWVQDAAATLTAAIAPMQFLARANYRQSGYSPFGIGLRYAIAHHPPDAPLPFETWAFRPPYLPSHLQFEVAHTQPHEPLIFVMPFANTRPDTLPPDRREPLDHAAQVQAVTGLRLTLPIAAPISPALQWLETAGLVSWVVGSDPLAEIHFDDRSQGRVMDFRPDLSLLFHD